MDKIKGVEIDPVKEKLIELLREVQYQGNAVHGYHDKYIQNGELADHLIANGVTVQEQSGSSGQFKWIPVTERLPEDDENLHFYDDGRMRCVTVLAYTEYGRIIPKNRLLVRPTGNEFLDTQVTDGWIWGSRTEDATHWMPLPQPPKGE